MSADNWGTCPQCKTEGSLREDYEIGFDADMKKFYVIYSGVCRYDIRTGGCGFEFKYKYEQKVKTEKKPKHVWENQ